MINNTFDDFLSYYGLVQYPCGYPYSRYSINIFGEVYDTVDNTWVEATRGANTQYVGVTMWLDGYKHSITVHIHRLLAKVFLRNDTGLPFEECQVDHLDGNKLNNCLSNLEIVTPQENKARAYRNGLRKDNNYTILTDLNTGESFKFYSQAEAARFLRLNPGSFSEYIKKYGNIIPSYHGYRIERIKQS